jgi:hypothetical protein
MKWRRKERISRRSEIVDKCGGVAKEGRYEETEVGGARGLSLLLCMDDLGIGV